MDGILTQSSDIEMRSNSLPDGEMLRLSAKRCLVIMSGNLSGGRFCFITSNFYLIFKKKVAIHALV